MEIKRRLMSLYHGLLLLMLVAPAAGAPACKSAHVASGEACVKDERCAAQYFVDVVSQTKTEAPVSLEGGRVVGENAIEIVVQHAAVPDRLVNRITLNAQKSDCNYPGRHWRKGVEANWMRHPNTGAPVCRDTYISDIPWTLDCGLRRTENATHVRFAGQGTVVFEEPLGSIDGIALGSREVIAIVQFAIVHPRTIMPSHPLPTVVVTQTSATTTQTRTRPATVMPFRDDRVDPAIVIAVGTLAALCGCAICCLLALCVARRRRDGEGELVEANPLYALPDDFVAEFLASSSSPSSSSPSSSPKRVRRFKRRRAHRHHRQHHSLPYHPLIKRRIRRHPGL